jgi:tRNA(Ile)-lysidine synthase
MLLRELAPAFAWRLEALHFDHGLRPGGRERERRLRARLAGTGVPLTVGRSAERPAPDHASLRRARYAWLRETARRRGADRIATAHQRDDQAETVLFRILRGTGNRGLAGIPARRGHLVRPLLPFGREELGAWLTERGFDAFDDPSNRDYRYARSRLRHRLLPALEDAAGPGVADRLVALGHAATDVCAAMETIAARALAAFATGRAAEWPAELRAEALRLAARRHGVRLRGAAARCAAASMLDLGSGHGLDLGRGLRLEREFDAWVIRRREPEPAPDEPLTIPSPAEGSGTFRLGGRHRRARWGSEAENFAGSTRVALYVRGDHYPLTIRARAPGDRIRLTGGTRKLGALLSEARVPVGDRPSVPLLVDRDGRVLAMLRRDLTHRVDRETRDGTESTNLTIEVEDG